MVLSTAGIVQQQVEWYGSVREEGRGEREAGSGKRDAYCRSRLEYNGQATRPDCNRFSRPASSPPPSAKFDTNGATSRPASLVPLPSSASLFPPMTEPHGSHASEELVDPLPALERAVADRPDDAKALVALANHYWLIGAGPEAVGDLASRAIASDPDNRAGWHLWALAESNPRERVARWQQVSSRFPADQLAKANLADNAASLAGAEHDYQAVDLAIDTYEELLATAEHPDQRAALEKAIKTLRGWKF